MNRRLPVVVIIVGLLAAALVFDGTRDDTAVVSEEPTVDQSVFPIAADPGALSSTWFCAGGTGTDGEDAFADHSVEIANPTGSAVTVTLTAFGGTVAPPLASVDPEDLDGETTTSTTATTTTTAPAATVPEPVTQQIEVPARGRQGLRLGDLVAAPVVSALVEAPSGGIVVEHLVSSVHGFDVKPCATSAAPEWHFAYGDTTVASRELLVLFNPFPDDAIVDGRFSTEDGIREPERFDGLVVPGRGTLAVDVGDDVTRREEVAATITTRSGRIVVDRIVRVDGETDRGLTLQLGVPAPQRTWVFPDGLTSETVREEYVVYNPGAEQAEVEIELVLDDPETNGIPESIDLSLPPGTHQTIDVNADGRVPVDVAHSGIVRSANGVPIVAERVLFSSGEDRRGIAVTTGSPVEAEEWHFAFGSVSERMDEFLVLVNLDPQILAEIDVTAVVNGQLVPVADLQGIELGGSERLAIRVGEHISNRPELPLVITSSEPIVVERALYRVGEDRRGISNALGVPAPAGIRIPADPLTAAGADDLDDPAGDPTDEGGADGDEEIPDAPADVDLPDPDETIVIDDPDAEADQPTTSTTAAATTSTTAAGEGDDPSE